MPDFARACYNNPTMPEPISNREKVSPQEIAALERLLEEKKKALAAEGKAVEEKEAFKETFRDAYGEVLSPTATPAPAVSLPSQVVLPPDELKRREEELKTKEREEQLEDLVTVAMTKGIPEAANLARRATPWLLDELHDRLQDRYYNHLVELRKLKAL